jgi:hypothetical protein
MTDESRPKQWIAEPQRKQAQQGRKAARQRGSEPSALSALSVRGCLAAALHRRSRRPFASCDRRAPRAMPSANTPTHSKPKRERTSSRAIFGALAKALAAVERRPATEDSGEGEETPSEQKA